MARPGRKSREQLDNDAEARLTQQLYEKIFAAPKEITDRIWKTKSNDMVETAEALVLSSEGYPLRFCAQYHRLLADRYSLSLLYGRTRMHGLDVGRSHRPYGLCHINFWSQTKGRADAGPWPWPTIAPTDRELVFRKYLALLRIDYRGPFIWSRPQQLSFERGVLADELLGRDEWN